MPDSFMTTKWLLNCHEFMIRFRGNKPYKLKTDLSLTLKSMQQKKKNISCRQATLSNRMRIVCAILERSRVTRWNLCARLSDLENETCNLLTMLLLLLMLLLVALLLLLLFIVLNLNKAGSIVHRPSLKPTKRCRNAKEKYLRTSKFGANMECDSRQRQINRNTEVLTHTHTHMYTRITLTTKWHSACKNMCISCRC